MNIFIFGIYLEFNHQSEPSDSKKSVLCLFLGRLRGYNLSVGGLAESRSRDRWIDGNLGRDVTDVASALFRVAAFVS